MKKQILSLDEQLLEEQNTVIRFIDFFNKDIDLSIVVYEKWTAKDVLGHITSWHMSFERNLLSAVNNEKAKPFTGSLKDVNENEVEKMSRYSKEELIGKIKKAQIMINMNIKNNDVKEIAYKRGSRNYTPIEHLEIVHRHISAHLKDLTKSMEKKYLS